MTHQWHDIYRHQKTPAHHLDPRSKLLVGLLFVGVVLLTPRFTRFQLLAYTGLIAITFISSGLSLRTLLQRITPLLPFVFLMFLSLKFSQLPLQRFLTSLQKALFSIMIMAVVTLTTPFPDLLRALYQWHFPRVFILFLAFLYRYGAVLQEEAIQLERAWTTRYFGGLWFRQWLRLGHVIAALLIRSYERAERVYAAMQSRGFSKESTFMGLLHFGIWDVVFIFTTSALLILLRWGPF